MSLGYCKIILKSYLLNSSGNCLSILFYLCLCSRAFIIILFNNWVQNFLHWFACFWFYPFKFSFRAAGWVKLLKKNGTTASELPRCPGDWVKAPKPSRLEKAIPSPPVHLSVPVLPASHVILWYLNSLFFSRTNRSYYLLPLLN